MFLNVRKRLIKIRIGCIYLKFVFYRKRKVQLYEEQSSNWNPKNDDKLGSIYGRWSKQKIDPYYNQELNTCKNHNMMVESNMKGIQVEQFVLEKYQNKDLQSLKENQFLERCDQRLQWKARDDATNNFQNAILDSTHGKAPQSFEEANATENHFGSERFLNNTNYWPCDSPYEGQKKNNQETIVSSISKGNEVDYGKEYAEVEHKRTGIHNINSNRISESFQNPNLSSKNVGCIEFIEPLSGWVYHTNYGILSGIYTLEQLQKGLQTNFLPNDLPIYEVKFINIQFHE